MAVGVFEGCLYLYGKAAADTYGFIPALILVVVTNTFGYLVYSRRI